ncbi:dynamin family protein [Thiomonas sp.]|uniref:dynamin family protein n=1 Tax=Thiomonas sp. TaxID=2047785 RepID=UPI002608CB43|nr:dynamin family protein [Thiomonas sp.]
MNPQVETPILTTGLFDYAEWRAERVQRLKALLAWLDDSGLAPEPSRPLLLQQIARLDNDRMTLAFVAEFSRGKSELINAIFFAGHGQRILPAGAGRTTMCPMELFSDPAQPRGLRLLPIDTRLQSQTLAQWKASPQVWTQFDLPTQDAQGLAQALTHLSDTQRVPLERAQELGFFHDAEELAELGAQPQDLVDIPLWRHALVNFAHPLLDQGLTILDTPGLNAVGAEPELTLSLIPSANAVVFVLGADTGVTRSDLDIWKRHIAPTSGSQTLVALNKVDALWDPLLSAEQVAATIDRQVQATAQTLQLPAERVFAVSAHKALLARIRGDAALLARSGLGQLENALNRTANIDRRRLLQQGLRDTIGQVQADLSRQLRSRLAEAQGQLDELLALRGKNAQMVVLMLQRLSAERSEFDAGMAQVLALRAVNNRMLDTLRERFAATAVLHDLEQLQARMSRALLKVGVKTELARISADLRARLVDAETQIEEIRQMLAAAFQRANSQFGFTVSAPRVLRLNALIQEFDRMAAAYTDHLSGVNWLKLQNNAYALRTLRAMAARVRDLFERALRDIENWDRSAIAQLDSQVRERKKQLNRRLSTLQRVEDTKDSLHERIEDLRAQVAQITALQQGLAAQTARVLDDA